MEDTKSKLIEVLNNHPKMLLGDMRSFLFLRTQGVEDLKTNSLGGGNFLSLVGQFAIINLLAKIYMIVSTGKLPKEGCNDPRTKVFTEVDAFVRLIKDYLVDLGLPRDDLETTSKVWRDLRNTVTHMSTIPSGYTITTLEHCTTLREAEHIVESWKQVPFVFTGKFGIYCYTDLLTRDLYNIIGWLIDYIEKANKSQDNIEIAYNWITENLS